MLTSIKTLLERFANNTSFDDLFESVNQIYRDADRDPELKGFFRKLDTFIRRCLKEQGYVLQDESNEEWNKLYGMSPTTPLLFSSIRLTQHHRPR